jgi:hypothetical protein
MNTYRKEIDALLRTVKQEGGVVYRAKSGHWAVQNPRTYQTIHVPSTPSRRTSVLNARSRLRKIGFHLAPKHTSRRGRLVSVLDQAP